MRLSFGHRGLRLFSSAILDQVVLSGTNFVAGFLLIRYATDQDYGLYVLVQATLLLLVSTHNAWLTAPLAILTPRLEPEQRRQTLGSVKRSQARLLRLCAPVLMCATALAYLSGLVDKPLAWVIFLGIVAGWAALRREYLRAVLLMYSRSHTLLGVDVVYAACLAIGVLAAVLIGVHVAVIATGALAAAAWAGTFAAQRSLAADPGLPGEGVVSIWPELRRIGFWSVLGSSIYWFIGQSYSYLLATRVDLKAVADVNAIRLLANPAIVLTIGLTSLLGPSAARWYAQMGIQPLVRRLLLILALTGFLELLYFAALWIARDWIVVNLLHKQINDRDHLLVLWALVAIIALCRDVLQCSLAAMGRQKSLAWQVGISAVVAVLLMWYGLAWWGPAAVLIGQVVGEIINVVGIVLLLRESMRLAATAAS